MFKKNRYLFFLLEIIFFLPNIGFILNIEKINIEHVDKILKIELESYVDPWKYEHFLYEIQNPHSKSFVALFENYNPCGYLITHHIIDNIYIINLAVEKSFRNKGIASMLLHNLFQYAQNKNVEKIDLEVRKSNKNALSLYKKEGFIKIGERKKFYSDGEDAIIMSKTI